MRRRRQLYPPQLQDSTPGTHVTAGATLWRQGEPATPMRVVTGVICYRRGVSSMGILGPGQVALPVPGRRDGLEAMTDLVAVSDGAVQVVSAESLTESEVLTSLETVLSAAERLGNLTLAPRIAAVLLELSRITKYPIVFCRQDALAMLVAARRETVSTILANWRDDEWIETRYRRIVIRQPEQLERVLRSGGRSSDTA